MDQTASLEWELRHIFGKPRENYVLFLFVDEYGFPYSRERYTKCIDYLQSICPDALPKWAWNCYGVLLAPDGATKAYPALILDKDIVFRGKIIRLNPFTSFLLFCGGFAVELDKTLGARDYQYFRKGGDSEREAKRSILFNTMKTRLTPLFCLHRVG